MREKQLTLVLINGQGVKMVKRFRNHLQNFSGSGGQRHHIIYLKVQMHSVYYSIYQPVGEPNPRFKMLIFLNLLRNSSRIVQCGLQFNRKPRVERFEVFVCAPGTGASYRVRVPNAP